MRIRPIRCASLISLFTFAGIASADVGTCVPSLAAYTWRVSDISGRYTVSAVYPTTLSNTKNIDISFTVSRSLDSVTNSCGTWSVDSVDPDVSFTVNTNMEYTLTIDGSRNVSDSGWTAEAAVAASLKAPCEWSASKSVPFGRGPWQTSVDSTISSTIACSAVGPGSYHLLGSVTASITRDLAYLPPQWGGAYASLIVDPDQYTETAYLEIETRVPEPATLWLFGLTALMILSRRAWRRRQEVK